MKTEGKGKLFKGMLLGGIFSLACLVNGEDAKTDAKSEIDLAKAIIVVGEKASEPEQFAAEELAKYAEKMSGAKPATKKENEEIKGNAILLGTLESNGRLKEIAEKEKIKTDKLDKEHDGFIIRTVGGNVVLIGSNPRSVLYGVYALLERFGCLWPAPGEDYVPTLKKLEVGNLDDVETADIDYRMRYGGGIESVAWVDWVAKNRINWIIFYNGAKPSWDDWEKNNIDSELVKRGVKVAFGLDYAVTYFLPSAKYYKDHPEYYALFNGKRIKHTVCVSNPDVIKLEAENIIEFLKKNPNVGMIILSMCDGYDYCECEKCMDMDKPLIKATRNSKTFSRSNSHTIFQNEVLNRVNKVFPDVKFMPTCYAVYSDPPRISSADLNKNLWFAYTFYVRCASHAIWDKDCEKNQVFYRDIEAWKKWCGSSKMIAWDLNCGMNCYRQMPFPRLISTAKDFPYYKNFPGVVIWHGTGWGKNYILNAYAAMRLAWNVNEKLDKILADYFNDYYGKAGNLMRDYYMGWEDIGQRLNASGKHWAGAWKTIATVDGIDKDIKKFEDIIIQAGKVSESAEIKRRIKEVENHFYYIKNVWLAIMKLNDINRYKVAGNQEQAEKGKEEFFKICEKINELLPTERVTGDLLSKLPSLPSSVNANDRNGSFEYGFLSWTNMQGHNRGKIDNGEFHSGKQSLKFTNTVPEDMCGICYKVEFNQKEPIPIRISGWNKVKETVLGSGRYCIYVDFIYEDGTRLKGQVVEFDREPHDWQYGEKIITPEKPVKSANVCVLFENNIGTTWFDDIDVSEVKEK